MYFYILILWDKNLIKMQNCYEYELSDHKKKSIKLNVTCLYIIKKKTK